MYEKIKTTFLSALILVIRNLLDSLVDRVVSVVVAFAVPIWEYEVLVKSGMTKCAI